MADYSGAMAQILSGKVNNPYLDQMATGIKNTVNDNLQNTLLPGIGSGAMAAGQYGGSRQGIAQGLAIGQSNKYLSDALSNLYGNQQTQANQEQANMTSQLSAQDQQTAINNANLALGYLNSNNNFYTANRGLDQSGMQLGSTLLGNGIQGLNNLGAQQAQIGQQQQNAPFSWLNNYSNIVNQYTGLGGSSTQTNSQGGGLTGVLGGALAGYTLSNGNSNMNPAAAPTSPTWTRPGMGGTGYGF